MIKKGNTRKNSTGFCICLYQWAGIFGKFGSWWVIFIVIASKQINKSLNFSHFWTKTHRFLIMLSPYREYLPDTSIITCKIWKMQNNGSTPSSSISISTLSCTRKEKTLSSSSSLFLQSNIPTPKVKWTLKLNYLF